MKLYNAGSFFDDRACAARRRPWRSRTPSPASRALTVEFASRGWSGDCTWRFRDWLAPPLDVAMGRSRLAHPDALARLNKGCTLDDFAAAACALRRTASACACSCSCTRRSCRPEDRTPWLLRLITVAIRRRRVG